MPCYSMCLFSHLSPGHKEQPMSLHSQPQGTSPHVKYQLSLSVFTILIRNKIELTKDKLWTYEIFEHQSWFVRFDEFVS